MKQEKGKSGFIATTKNEEVAKFLGKHIKTVSPDLVELLLIEFDNIHKFSPEIMEISGTKCYNGDIPIKEANKLFKARVAKRRAKALADKG